MKIQFKKIFVAAFSLIMLASCGGKTDTHTHTYGDPSWNWDGYTAATATFECSSCAKETEGHSSKVTAKITSAVTKEATCLESGIKTYTATVSFKDKNYTNTKDETLAPLGHTYGKPTWNWNGFESAQATFVCSACSEQTKDHSLVINASISSEITESPSCAQSGTKTYIASVTLKDKTYQDAKDETLAPLGHTYGQPSWDWNGFEAAKAVFECSECSHEEEGHSVDVDATITSETTEDPTCTAGGTKTYTATAEFDGSTYIDTKTDSIAPLGHKYGEPTWDWTGFESAKATFVCSECGVEEQGHSVDVDATITSETTTDPTCTTSGVKTYTATVEFEEKEYTNDKEETLAPVGHSYGTPTWTWTEYSAAKATFVCSECAATVEGHSVDVDATITSTHTDGTCLVKGHNDYTASVTFKGSEYKDTKVEDLGFGSHSYGEFEVTKEPTYDEEGSKTRTCSTCKDKDTVSIPKLVMAYSVVKPLLQAANAKDSFDIYSGDAYEDALIAYNRLDFANMSQAEKDEAAGLKDSIAALQTAWKKLYKKALDVKDIDKFNDAKTEYLTDIKQEKGHMLKIASTLTTSATWSYSGSCKIDVGDAEYVQFGYYQDQPGDVLVVNSAWTKFLDLTTGVVYTEQHVTKGLKNKEWNQISIPADAWAEMGDFKIAVYVVNDLPYGIKNGGEPAYMTSIYTSKSPTEEGFAVFKGANNITDVQTWGASVATTEISYNVKSDKGYATKVDIKSKTSVVELKWANVNYSYLNNYDYVRFYIYAKTTQRVFISLSSWRNNVVSLPNVDPLAADNGTKADAVQSAANVVADQWNIIDVPSAYFKKDTDNSFFIEIWADQNVAKDGWLIADAVGHNGDFCIDNGGQLINHNAQLSVTPTTDETYGGVTKATLNQANGFIRLNRLVNISKFTTIKLKVKNLETTQMKIVLYLLKDDIYAAQVKDPVFSQALAAGVWTDVSIPIATYVGPYASGTYLCFRIDGAKNNSCLLTGIYASK